MVFISAKAQNFAEAIKKGDDAFKSQQYKKAIDFYFAAAAYLPDNKGEVKDKVNMVFEAIEDLRKKAEGALAETKK